MRQEVWAASSKEVTRVDVTSALKLGHVTEDEEGRSHVEAAAWRINEAALVVPDGVSRFRVAQQLARAAARYFLGL